MAPYLTPIQKHKLKRKVLVNSSDRDRYHQTKEDEMNGLLKYLDEMDGNDHTANWLDYAHNDFELPPGILEEAIRRNTRLACEFEFIAPGRETAPDDINEWDEDTLHLLLIGILDIPRSWLL